MKRISVVTSIFLLICILCGCCSAEETAAALVADSPTTQYFTDEAVADADIDQILLAGVNAASSMNSQPWHFTAITDTSVLQQIADDMSSGMSFGAADTAPEGSEPSEGEVSDDPSSPDGETLPEGAQMPAAPAATNKAGIADVPLAIVISCKEGNELDAGLACQSMAIEAQLLGYGTKIVSSPTIALNGSKQADYKALLGIPEDQTAAAILLVGVEDTSVDETMDGYTAATTRNPLEDMITYIKSE